MALIDVQVDYPFGWELIAPWRSVAYWGFVASDDHGNEWILEHNEKIGLRAAICNFEDGKKECWRPFDAHDVWVEGLKRWGQKWVENDFPERFDIALQMNLFGEVKYG